MMIDKLLVQAAISDMRKYFEDDNGKFSETRDIFTARLYSYIQKTERYLEAAIIGEIGNNTFDHNFGFISNNPRGAYCNFAYKQKYTLLADYGKGLKQSLSSVLPSIISDLEAIEIAFTKRISGRSPEQRGNGLKFVSESIQQNNWNLFFQSGSASCSIDRTDITFLEETTSLPGCMLIINFKEDK